MMHYQFAAVFTAYFFLNYKMYKQILINVIKTLSIELTIYFFKKIFSGSKFSNIVILLIEIY